MGGLFQQSWGVQFSSVTQSCLTHTQVCPYTAVHQASSSFTVSQRLLKLMSIESVMLSNHRMLCLPLLLLSSIFPSIRGFSNESAFPIRWPEYWGFSFSISPSNEYSESISFRIDWFDLLAAQRTLKNLLQYHRVQKHQFFGTQISLWSNSQNLSSPMATAVFSKFAGILSAALSQHHLLGFEIAQLEFHHFH